MVRKRFVDYVLRRERLCRWCSVGGAVFAALALVFVLLSGLTTQGRAALLQPQALSITKSSTTSLVESNNSAAQAVAGELVTVTVVYHVTSPDVVYDASPRVVLEDGLYPIGSSPAWSAIYTGTTSYLRSIEGAGNVVAYGGALMVFPTQGTITGTDQLTMTVYAVRTQRRYVAGTEISNGTNLRVQGILRYCASAPGCGTTAYLSNSDTTAQVNAIQPLVNTTYGMTYLDTDGLGAGGGQVRLTFNATNASGRPTAHDMVYTATLGSGLTYVASSGSDGAGAGAMSSGSGGVTYVVWNVPVSLAANAGWQAVVTATLPNPFVIGREFTYQGQATYETFDGNMEDEGKYTTTGALQTLRPGLSAVTKTSDPASGAVTMGDFITYTVVFRQAANTLLQSPQMLDTQPLGFHYVSGTLTVQNATVNALLLAQGVSEGSGDATRHYENLQWVMDDLASSATTRVVTATYTVLNTGLDYNGLQVYYTAADMRASKASISGSKTGAVLSWTPPTGSTYNTAARANAGALGVIQPFMGDQFSTLRTDAGAREVGQSLNFETKFRNNGYSSGSTIIGIPAHELQVCDTLPAGLVFAQDNGCWDWTSNACPFSYTAPTMGATGEVCWTVGALPKTANNQTYEFRYSVQVTDAAYPGNYTNDAFVKTYSSKAGVVEGERVYSEFPNGLVSANCGANCYTILGLAASKTALQSSVAPGDLITYVLAYTDTSAMNDYTGLVMVDTYDSLLAFVSSTPAPSNHNVGARELTWNLGALPTGSNGQVQLVMRVSSVITGRYMLTNTMLLDSDQTSPRTWVKNTPIDVAALHVSMSGPATTHAGDSVVYTVIYSNTGSWNNAPITLTLDYGPYLTYDSASLTPVPSTGGTVFVTTVPNNGSDQILTINLTVNAPLPYTLEEITSSVELASAGAPSQNDAWTMALQRPTFVFYKTGPAYAPNVGGTIQYAFHLQNTGDYTATNLVITDTWDSGTAFQSGTGWTSYGDYGVYTIASLAPGATAIINPLSVQVVTLRDNYLNEAELSSFQTSIQNTHLRIWSPSIQLSKTAYPTPAFPGRVLTYTLTYTNVGGVTVSHAVITDTLPDAFTYQDHTVSGAGCAAGWQFSIVGQVATWTCDSLSYDAVGQLQIWGVVAIGAENSWLANMAASDGAPPIPYRPMDEPLRTLVARPWLSVDKVGAPTHPVAPGDYVTYTLTYENYGSYPAYGVVIKDQLPTQLTFAGCDPACAHSSGLVTWTIGEVPTDTTDVVTVYATVNTGTGGQTAVNQNYTIENTTVWQKLTPDQTLPGAPVNTVILNPQLALTKAAGPEVVVVNDTIFYTITYQNTGGGLLHNVHITDTLNGYTAFFNAPGCLHSGEASGGVVTCDLGDLENGETRQAFIRVRVLPGLQLRDKIFNLVQGRADETVATSSNQVEVCYGECESWYYLYLPLVMRGN